MEVQLLSVSGQSIENIIISDKIFGRNYNEALIHQLLVAFQANARHGTRAQLNRASVRHTTKKPWRQKGTGRARAGMASSPLWRGGGRAFPSLPEENFSQKVNKKMYKVGMCSIFSQLLREDRFTVIEDFSVSLPKTQVLLGELKKINLSLPLLMVMDDISDNLWLAARNLFNMGLLTVREINPLVLLFFQRVVFTKAALVQLEEGFL